MNTRPFLCSFFMEVFNIANNKDNLINEEIKAKEVMVIGPNGEQLGIKSINDALTLAGYAGFDLVLMSESANPPVCKIMDYNKFKYEKKKKTKEAQKRQREATVDIKEFRLSVTIDKHDFDFKAKNAKKFLEEGNKVKITLKFRGREMNYIKLGEEVLNNFITELEDVAVAEKKPILEGKNMFIILAKKA